MKCCVGLIVIVCLFVPLTCFATGKLTLLTEDLPPFNYTENGVLTGVTTQVVKEITRRLGINSSIDVVPWARGYHQLRTEPNVVLFTTVRTPKRAPLFHWVGPLYTSQLAFYARKDSPLSIDSIESARQVGAIATYKHDSGEQILKSLGFTNLDSSKNPLSNIRKLLSGRVDLWFFHNMGAPQVALEAGVDPTAIKPVFTYREYVSFIAISKQTPLSTVHAWQRTLDALKADGTFWWLARKWLPADAILVAERQTAPEAPFSLQLFTEDSPPSSYVQDGRLTGLSVDIVREILQRIGKPETLSLVPWARGYKLARSNADRALFATTRLPQREELFAWVGPLYDQQWGFYRWKDNHIDIVDIDAAKRVERIGTYHQDAKMQYLQTLGFDNLVPTNTNITNIKHLQRGDIDLWVSSDFNMSHLARQAGVSPDDLDLSYVFKTVSNYIAFSPQTSPHTIRLWQRVLDDMKRDGSYQRICDTYGYHPESTALYPRTRDF